MTPSSPKRVNGPDQLGIRLQSRSYLLVGGQLFGMVLSHGNLQGQAEWLQGEETECRLAELRVLLGQMIR